jgi:hypothetical protein
MNNRNAAKRMRPQMALRFVSSVLLLAAAGCYEEGWESSEGLRASDDAVARALGDGGHGEADVSAKSVPVIEPPGALRPCCAFGVDLQVEVGRVSVPGIEDFPYIIAAVRAANAAAFGGPADTP